ncbi:hypothetical protein JHK86_024816 [Glycine max]|nr:hypothetical protein JHK86_024816 [Glycine max]
MCRKGFKTTGSSLKSDMYKPQFAGFVDVDLAADKNIFLRSLIDHSVVESFGAGGKTNILSRVHPELAVMNQAYLFVFNNGLDKKEDDQSGAVVKENVHWKSKSAIKQKKKDNSSKDQKESQDQSDSINVGSRTFETTDIEKAEDVSAIDVKEKLKKVTSMKKKGDGCCCTSNYTNHANVATQSQPHSIGAPLETSHMYSQVKPQVFVDAQADTDWGLFGRNQNGLSGGVATSVDTDDLGRFSPLP